MHTLKLRLSHIDENTSLLPSSSTKGLTIIPVRQALAVKQQWTDHGAQQSSKTDQETNSRAGEYYQPIIPKLNSNAHARAGYNSDISSTPSF
jgi:hypothetical protein